MEIILDRHLVTMEEFVAERKKARKSGWRRSDAARGRVGRF
jgi:hypothetical protein